MFRLACLCPTYKRPEMLANAAACYLNQEYDPAACRLFICDDVPQHLGIEDDRICVLASSVRFPNLPSKYNYMAEYAIASWKPDGLVVWEDDDVFLPWHLSQIGHYFEKGVRYFRPPTVWSDYGQNKSGHVILEPADGRFHSAWAFTTELFLEVGGYPKTGRLDFDQQLGSIMSQADPRPIDKNGFYPSYVYRWGNPTYHGSQAGEEGYAKLWKAIGDKPAPWVGELRPRFDEETEKILGKFSDASRHA